MNASLGRDFVRDADMISLRIFMKGDVQCQSFVEEKRGSRLGRFRKNGGTPPAKKQLYLLINKEYGACGISKDAYAETINDEHLTKEAEGELSSCRFFERRSIMS